MTPAPPVSDYHVQLAAMRETVREAWRAEEAARRRLSVSPTNLHLRMKLDEAEHKRQEAQQAMDEYRGES